MRICHPNLVGSGSDNARVFGLVQEAEVRDLDTRGSIVLDVPGHNHSSENKDVRGTQNHVLHQEVRVRLPPVA
jgi:hypothetical protein